MDFHQNKRLVDEIAIVPSKRLRNKIAGFTTHLMKRIQKGPVRGISFKLQEEERERKDVSGGVQCLRACCRRGYEGTTTRLASVSGCRRIREQEGKIRASSRISSGSGLYGTSPRHQVETGSVLYGGSRVCTKCNSRLAFTILHKLRLVHRPCDTPTVAIFTQYQCASPASTTWSESPSLQLHGYDILFQSILTIFLSIFSELRARHICFGCTYDRSRSRPGHQGLLLELHLGREDLLTYLTFLQDLLRSIGLDGLQVNVVNPIAPSAYDSRRRGPPGAAGARGPRRD